MFNNKPNFKILDQQTNTEYWISRACCVTAVVIYKCNDRLYTPLGLRADHMPLCPNMWGIPCGYIDWNETAKQAVRREVYEEVGLLLNEDDIFDQPDYVETIPDDFDNQNISLRFIIFKEVGELPALKVSSEASQVRWSSLEEIGQLAFNHQEVIEWAVQILKGAFII